MQPRPAVEVAVGANGVTQPATCAAEHEADVDHQVERAEQAQPRQPPLAAEWNDERPDRRREHQQQREAERERDPEGIQHGAADYHRWWSHAVSAWLDRYSAAAW